jgi:hypothetical protein
MPTTHQLREMTESKRMAYGHELTESKRMALGSKAYMLGQGDRPRELMPESRHMMSKQHRAVHQSIENAPSSKMYIREQPY